MSDCFSICTDETTHVSIKEQLSLCVRFVNNTLVKGGISMIRGAK